MSDDSKYFSDYVDQPTITDTSTKIKEKITEKPLELGTKESVTTGISKEEKAVEVDKEKYSKTKPERIVIKRRVIPDEPIE